MSLGGSKMAEDASKRGEEGPKTRQERPNEAKKLKKYQKIKIRWPLGGPRASQKAQQAPKHLPKGVQEGPKEAKKGSENVIILETHFRHVFYSIFRCFVTFSRKLRASSDMRFIWKNTVKLMILQSHIFLQSTSIACKNDQFLHPKIHQNLS